MAAWLLEKTQIRARLIELIPGGDLFHQVRQGAFVEGPIRILFDTDLGLITINNVDYSSGLQDEGVGLIDLSQEMGLCAAKPILASTFERSLFIIVQRLRNLIFETNYYHQGPFAQGGHKILAGRGADARDFSLGYYEEQVAIGKSSIKCIVVAGPVREWESAANLASDFRPRLPKLASHASEMLQGKVRGANLLGRGAFVRLRHEITPPESQQFAATLTTRARSLDLKPNDVYTTLDWTYDQWTASESPLSNDQRRIFQSDSILHHPLRIIGPAGSGKTLLMQLMTVKRLREGSASRKRVLYVTHNNAMEVAVRERFRSLMPTDSGLLGNLAITTLSRLSKDILGLKDVDLLEGDALDAKTTQRSFVREAFLQACNMHAETISASPVLQTIISDTDGLIDYVRADISVAIKGQRKESDRAGYIGSERPLAKLHGLLTPEERSVIFDAFEIYQAELETHGVIDSDDVAITYLARVTTPLWSRQRKTLGFDFIFVDEAQLFVENEQRLFPLLSTGDRPYVPIVLALDEAQQFYGEPKTGLAMLGLPNISRETLSDSHRMSSQIADLAFFVISRSVDLFSFDFPDFENYRERREDSQSPARPLLEVQKIDVKTVARTIVNRVRNLRRNGMRQIAIVCHSDAYWPLLHETLTSELSDLDLSILTERGDRPNRNHAFAVLSKPGAVGGTEFDAVIAVGLEKGLNPKLVPNDPALQSAFEQQSLREIYLTISRARHQVIVVIAKDAEPSSVILAALDAGLIERIA